MTANKPSEERKVETVMLEPINVQDLKTGTRFQGTWSVVAWRAPDGKKESCLVNKENTCLIRLDFGLKNFAKRIRKTGPTGATLIYNRFPEDADHSVIGYGFWIADASGGAVYALVADSIEKPSQVSDRYWIHASRKKGKYPKSIERSGKWLIFVKNEDVDKVWEQIKEATVSGKLGNSSKVATAKPNPNAVDSDKKVICVYTYDWTDEKDVKRVREELRALGIVWKIPYKADADTLAGKYQKRGDTRISKYYE